MILIAKISSMTFEATQNKNWKDLPLYISKILISYCVYAAVIIHFEILIVSRQIRVIPGASLMRNLMRKPRHLSAKRL